MSTQGDTPVALSLVEEIAKLRDPAEGGKSRRHLSFASKFAHFFIDDEIFPIYDSYAAMMLNYHLRGHAVAPYNAPPYAEYITDLKVLREQAEIACRPRQLDAYLWLAGLYVEWRKPRSEGKQAEINREVRELFEQGEEVAEELEALLPGMSERSS